jgi:hypothetical protein
MAQQIWDLESPDQKIDQNQGTFKGRKDEFTSLEQIQGVQLTSEHLVLFKL